MTIGEGWQFWVDVGGTFTDCIGRKPDGSLVTHKLLSSATYKGTVRGIGENGKTIEIGHGADRVVDFFKGYLFDLYDETAIESSGQVGHGARGMGAPRLGAVQPGATERNVGSRREGREARAVADVKALAKGVKVVRSDPMRMTIELERPIVATKGMTWRLRSPEPAPVCGIRWLLNLPITERFGQFELRLGTTIGTNALLEGKGERVAFVTTEGFGDALEIGYQNRPELFNLAIKRPRPLYATVIEVRERLSARGEVIRRVDRDDLRAELARIRSEGIDSLAVCLLHSYVNREHEDEVRALAREMGFQKISLSADVAPVQRLVARAHTTVLDAYLAPIVAEYLRRIASFMPEANIKLMTSSGGLVPLEQFSGKDSILSGPAGGVVGAAKTAELAKVGEIISFDMGGTSTDVSRWGGERGYERRFEMEVLDQEKGVATTIVAPMLSVETVAAGGGSICWFDGGRLRVGPRSAGAFPGPACYGNGGPLTITDINVFLGRVVTEHFSFALDHGAVARKLDELIDEIQRGTGVAYGPEELAEGLLKIAVANMAAPITKISMARGHDVRRHALVSFGGAGAQHACSLADSLGISKVIQHPLSSLLSAYGIGLSDVTRIKSRDLAEILDDRLEARLQPLVDELSDELRAELIDVGAQGNEVESLISLDLRYRGQDSVIAVAAGNEGACRQAFETLHYQRYGFLHEQREIEVRRVRVEMTWRSKAASRSEFLADDGPSGQLSSATEKVQTFLGGSWQEVPLYAWRDLERGDPVNGPALIVGRGTTIVVEPGWTAALSPESLCILERLSGSSGAESYVSPDDPISVTLMANRITALAEQMGTQLQTTSLSVNIKERLDFSCAIFTADGKLLVNAPHIPVHLGAMGETIRHLLASGLTICPGDVFVCNDPYQGGSHLPDVTVITPVFGSDRVSPLFFVGNRAHHAEIGGATPGSMPPFSRTLAEEGVIIPFTKVVSGGESRREELFNLLTAGPYPSRSPESNLADIDAQIAANEVGKRLMGDLIGALGEREVARYMDAILALGERKMIRALSRVGQGRYQFADAMDDGTELRVAIEILGAECQDVSTEAGLPSRVRVSFAGTGPASSMNLNANRAIVRAAVLYAFRCLINEDVPLNDGVMAPVELDIPDGTILSPAVGGARGDLPAVVGGNVETSQRIVDVLLGALGLAAASQGTMNNFLFGRAPSADGEGFGFYETIAGGAGAGPYFDGQDVTQVHMTNTRITDPEVLEERYPVRLIQFKIRNGSGGKGRHRGGHGAAREVEFLAPLEVSLLCQRRQTAPFGLNGGGPGEKGENWYWEDESNVWRKLPGSAAIRVRRGDRIRILTPGGGAYGACGEA